MKNIEVRESESVLFNSFSYETAEEALEAYASLTDGQRMEMAKVYQEAFGGYPWFESFRCMKCDEFSKEQGVCAHCGGDSFAEAYPIDWLVDEYFPHMMSQYAPGVLVTLEDEGKMIGFTTGGAITLGKLIEDKYKGKPEILESIIQTTGVSPDEVVFYENETCVSASLQQKGSGRKLNLARVSAAYEMGFPLVCGRTINQPWIKLKRQQLGDYGYDFVNFNPDGDMYEVDGTKRQFFMAKKK